MDQQAELVVDRLKAWFRAQTDQELADALKVGRSTVTSWRRRASIPDTFVPVGLSSSVWTSTEHAACTLGMMRLIKGFGSQVADDPGFLQKGGFLPMQRYSTVGQALSDLQSAMKARRIEDPAQCANMMVYEEFFAQK